MELKWMGAVLSVAGCTGFGMQLAMAYRRETAWLEELSRVILYLTNELSANRTALPELCAGAACQTRGRVRQVFLRLGELVEGQAGEDAYACMKQAMGTGFSRQTERVLLLLGQTLSTFDLPGQMKSLAGLGRLTEHLLEERSRNAGELLRCYRVLGICAGVSVAVLLL